VAQTFRQSLQNKHKECPDGFVSMILNILIPIKKWGNSWNIGDGKREEKTVE
jgi:hypothetical protein